MINWLQRIVLVVATLAIAVFILFPPWTYIYLQTRAERPAGFHLITNPPTPVDISAMKNLFGIAYNINLESFSSKLNGTQLAVEVLGTAIVTFLLFLLLKTRST